MTKTIREHLEALGGLDRIDVSGFPFLDRPAEVELSGFAGGVLSTTCGGDAVLTFYTKGMRAAYVVYWDREGKAWDTELRAMADRGEYGRLPFGGKARPHARLRLVQSA